MLTVSLLVHLKLIYFNEISLLTTMKAIQCFEAGSEVFFLNNFTRRGRFTDIEIEQSQTAVFV